MFWTQFWALSFIETFLCYSYFNENILYIKGMLLAYFIT